MTFDSIQPDDVLAYTINVLKKAYKIAKRRGDTVLMLAIADRLVFLHENMENIDKQRKHTPVGFGRLLMEDENDRG